MPELAPEGQVALISEEIVCPFDLYKNQISALNIYTCLQTTEMQGKEMPHNYQLQIYNDTYLQVPGPLKRGGERKDGLFSMNFQGGGGMACLRLEVMTEDWFAC